MKLHIDGARIFNAATALNTSVAKLLEKADSAVLSLCKGLCAPVGAVVVGSREFIEKAFKLVFDYYSRNWFSYNGISCYVFIHTLSVRNYPFCHFP